MESLPAVASNFTTACKKCAEDRFHKVIAHVDEKKAKIECEVCGKKSTFKLVDPKKKKVKRKVTRRLTPEAKWEVLKEAANLNEMTSYTIKGNFNQDSAIDHPKFGIGVVTESLPEKIHVTFIDGEKLLIHNRK